MQLNRNAVSMFFFVLACFNLPATSYADWNVLILETMHVPVVEQHSLHLQNDLKEAAGKHDQTIRIQTFNADGDVTWARHRLKKTLAEDRPDLVVSVATLATQVASRMLKGTDIPLLFCVVADPVGAGIVPQEGPDKDHHISGFIYGIDRKTSVDTALRIARSKSPEKVVRLGIIYSRYASSISDLKGLSQLFAEVPGIEIVPISVPYLDGEAGMQTMLNNAAGMIEDLDKHVDFWWQVKGPLAEDPRFHELFKKSNKPILFGNNVQSVQAGAIVSMGPQISKTSQELAGIATEVLQGTPVNQFKIGYASSYDIAVNLDTATKHNLKIPQDIIEKAGDNIVKTVR